MIILRWICIYLMSNRSKMLMYKSDLITMNCIDFISNRFKTTQITKAIKLQWIASIWRHNDQKCWVTSQNIQNNAKVQKRSNYDQLHRFHLKSIKTTQITKVIKLQWLASIWCQNIENNPKQQMTSNYDEFASIWHPKCWVTSQWIQNNTKLQK